MQEENQTFWTFLSRTDALAEKLGCQVQELAEVIGISRSTLFACRNQKTKITEKTLAKLASAERRAGIGVSYVSEVSKTISSMKVRETEREEDLSLLDRVRKLEREVDDLRRFVGFFPNGLLHDEDESQGH